MPSLVKHEINNRIGKLIYRRQSEKVKSTTTGNLVELQPEAVSLYHYILGSSYVGDKNGVTVGKQIFKSHFSKEYDQLF